MDNEIAGLFLDFSCRRLDMVATNMKTCLGKLTDEQIWARGGAHENAVGNLVLHLCGNIRQWVMHGIGQTKDVRVREAEFATDGGLTGAALAEMFSMTVAEAQGVIASLPAKRLTERTSPQPGRPEVSVLEAIYQVVAHAHEHVGQVILVTTLGEVRSRFLLRLLVRTNSGNRSVVSASAERRPLRDYMMRGYSTGSFAL